MDLLWIVNNYDSMKDAIGRYAKCICDSMRCLEGVGRIYIETGNTADKRKIQKLFSFEMARAYRRARARLIRDRVQAVIVEYPFIEWNPYIIVEAWLLYRCAKQRGIKVVLSLHEFERMHKLRKWATRQLIACADIVLAAEKTDAALIRMCGKEVYQRSIASPISISWSQDEEKTINRKFIYFGLINSSKAFKEMIHAFKAFNSDKNKRLDIYTSIPLDGVQLPEGVNVYYERADREIEVALKDSTYCIAPILPKVTARNSTLKCAAQAGCTVIGCFDDETGCLPFCVNLASYSEQQFAEGLKTAYMLSEKEIRENEKLAREYGEQFSFDRTARETMAAIKRVVAQ